MTRAGLTLLLLICILGAFAGPAAATPARPLSDAEAAQIRAFMATPPFNEAI
jgi:hypothetical protein